MNVASATSYEVYLQVPGKASQELLAMQGFDPRRFHEQTMDDGGYSLANHLAGLCHCLLRHLSVWLSHCATASLLVLLPSVFGCSAAGNAMTASVLSAVVFGILCWALPRGQTEQAVMSPPDPERLLNWIHGDMEEEAQGSSEPSAPSGSDSGEISDGSERSRSRPRLSRC